MISPPRLRVVSSFHMAYLQRARSWVLPRWRQCLIVAIVLLASAVVGQNSSPVFLLVPPAIALALAMLLRPEFGLLCTIIALMCIKYTIGTGTETRLHAGVFLIPLLVGGWLLNRVRQRRLSLVPSPLNLPLLAFVACTFLAFIAGNLPWNYFTERASIAAQLGGLAIFLLSAGMFLLGANQIRQMIWLKILAGVFVALALLGAIRGVVPALSGASRLVLDNQAVGSMMWVWASALLGGQALFNRQLLTSRRALVAGLAVLVFVCGFVGWRSWASGWLPALVVLLALLWLYSWRVCLLTVGVAALLILGLDPSLPSRLISGDLYSILTRQTAGQILIDQVFTLSPIFGLGPANYYHYTPLFPIRGYYVEFNSHNNYLDILLQTGILGLACFLWFVGSVGVYAWRLRSRVDAGFARGYVYACLAGLIGTLVSAAMGDWVIPFAYNTGFPALRSSLMAWLLLGGLVVVGNQCVGQTAQNNAR